MMVATKEKIGIGLSGNQLKIIAMLTMLVDHIGVQLFPECIILRIIGRLSLPIFAYMIAEGCLHTRNRPKYLLLIALLGFGCQIVYYVAMRSLYMGILITFSLSIVSIYSVDLFLKRKNVLSGVVMSVTLAAVVFACVVAPVLWVGHGFHVDYGLGGVLMPVLAYYAKNRLWKLACIGFALLITVYSLGAIQWYAFLALPLLALYNGTRGKWKLKYVFYIFYPVHLGILYLISLWM